MSLEERLQKGSAQPTGFRIYKVAQTKVLKSELEKVVNDHPNHPLCEIFRNALSGMENAPDDKHLTIASADLQAILEGKTSKEVLTICPKTGDTIVTKEVVESGGTMKKKKEETPKDTK